jgi:hypothetical protein
MQNQATVTSQKTESQASLFNYKGVMQALKELIAIFQFEIEACDQYNLNEVLTHSQRKEDLLQYLINQYKVFNAHTAELKASLNPRQLEKMKKLDTEVKEIAIKQRHALDILMHLNEVIVDLAVEKARSSIVPVRSYNLIGDQHEDKKSMAVIVNEDA